jgi:CspA family cold shock protein
MKGNVKFFDETKGFGFIAGEDGKEYFVHQTALAQGMRLNENDAVTFDVEQGDRGPKAANVQMDTGEAEAPAEEAPAEAPAENTEE